MTVPKISGRDTRRARGPGDGRGRSPRVRRGIAGAAAALVAAGTLAGCGGGNAGGTPTLTWYINPDSGGQAEIAAACSDASNGAFKVEVSQLSLNSEGHREQLVRRLAAGDT